MDAAILFESDAFRLDGQKLMGRQAAGNGFLRAFVAAHAGRDVWGFSTFRNSSEDFRRTVHELDPSVKTHWIAGHDFKGMAARRVLFRPDCVITDMASARLRPGIGAYSLVGITHTLSGPPQKEFARYARAPLAPWDALICTSRAAVSAVEDILEAEESYLAWRFRQKLATPRPQLPVIPLGVHAADFADRPSRRAPARVRLNLADDEVVVLFAGRRVFHAKAHPYQMYAALETAARRTGRKVVLIQAGQAPNAEVDEVFRSGMDAFCPSVRGILIDGKDFDAYADCWSAADVFMSLSDNIQETFGITPIEAMASGLPVIVSDWDGYRDTVRDGEDGFRIPTYAPAPGMGTHIAASYETNEINYDYMLYRTCMAVGLDMDILADRVCALVDDADLRRRMGASGLERARTVYDWAVVYRRYQALWDDLDRVRLAERDRPEWAQAPMAAPDREDPFKTFQAFPTHHIGPETRLQARPGATSQAYFQLQSSPLFDHWKVTAPIIDAMFKAMTNGQPSCAELGALSNIPTHIACEVAGRLVKMQLASVV